MIQIYSENNTNYDYNGDVVLDPEVCDLKVTLNGSWEVTLECALDEEDKFQEILTNAVLSTDTPVGKKQLFRLYDVQRSDTGVIAYARPIFLDSSKDVFFTDCRPTELTGQEALDYLMNGTPYSGYTDITLKKTAYYIRKNLIEAIAGNEDNSFLNRWGGEIVYDNYKVNILVQQGEDRGLRVEFGTNIESIQETIDVDEMGTRLIPVAFNGRTLDGDEPWVDSPLIDNYPIIYHKIVEFEDMRLLEDFNLDEDGNPTEDMDDYDVYDTLAELQAAMVERCKQLFVEGIDTPSITYDVSMIDLRQTDEYKEYQDLETVNLGDTVYCYHRRLGIETKARVIEYTFDCIRQCITEVVIGDYQEDYLDHLSDITSSSGGNVDFSQIWSQFDYIEANYVKTNQLEAEVGKFGYLTAAEADITYARITDLQAALIEVNELIANEIYAVYANIDTLDATVANIVSLLGGNVATGTLDTIHLTADNAVIDSEVVLQAIIEEAIIGDLLAGYIYTDYVTIMDNENGNMILAGPTIQFKDLDGNYRMQVGLDAYGNFNIYILNEDGDTIFDALGLTEAGLVGNGAIIRDVAVADDANISGYKLNIQEVASILNDEGLLIVDAGQVIIDGQQLSAVYTQIRQDVDSALTEAEQALEAAGELVEIGARNYLLNTRSLSYEEDKTIYLASDWILSQDESEFGVLTENNNGSVLMLTAISASKNSLSGKKMVFAADILEENLTSILDDYDLQFGIWKSDDDGVTWYEYASIGSTLNEDDVFTFNRNDLVDDEWCRLIAKFTATAAHIHSTDSRPTFIWDDSDMTCKVTYTCDSCGEEVTEDCDVTEKTVDATCEVDGSITYTASFTSEGVTYTDEKVIVIPALGHDWDSSTIITVWATDYSSCQLSITCKDCGETFTYDSTSVTSEITKEATCTEDGNILYTAKFDIPEGRSGMKISGMTTNVTMPALGHSYGEPVFNWSDNYESCTATFTCERGDDVQIVQCTVTVDGDTYTATVEFEGETYTDVYIKQTAFAIYSADDSSLTFYMASDVPSEGDIYNNKTVNNIYTDFVDSTWSGYNQVPWYSIRRSIVSVEFDTSFKEAKPVSMAYWFYDMANLTNIVDVSNIETSNVKTLYYTFYGCYNLATLDLSGWDVSNVTTLFGTFRGCSDLTSLDVPGWGWNTAKVTNMQYTFHNCSGLTALDVSTWDVSNVTNLYYTFFNCSSLITLDVSKWDTSKVTNMGGMFYACYKLTTIYSDDNVFVTTAVTNGSNMFLDCTNLVGGNGTKFDSSNVSYTMAHVDTADNPGYFTQAESGKYAFAIYSEDDNSLTFYMADEIPNVGDNYKGKVVTNIYTDFVDSTWSLYNQIPWYSIRRSIVSVEFDTSFKEAKPVSMAYWFYDMANLTDVINTSNIDTSNVRSLGYTFYRCSSLTSLDVSTWDVSNVQYLYYAFQNCANLTSLDVSTWNTSKVINMEYMFDGCIRLTTIYSDDNVFVTTAVLYGVYVFTNCTSLVGGNGTTYSPSNVAYTMAHIDTADNPGYFTDIADKT